MSKLIFFKKVNGKFRNLKERIKECEVRFFSDVGYRWQCRIVSLFILTIFLTLVNYVCALVILQ